MSSIVNKITIEEYEDSFGCPQYELMGYQDLEGLFKDIIKTMDIKDVIQKKSDVVEKEGVA